MAFEDPGHVVKEFGGGSDMGHPNEEPVVLDCIECLHAVHGGSVQCRGPWSA